MADSRARQEATSALLTRTPTLEIATTAPTVTLTPRPPTGVPQPTPFVYDDPSGWEFVEKTDPTGKTYLDLQDWQKQQVWHAFNAFWDLLYHNPGGLPDWAEVQPYVAGSFTQFAHGTYDFADQNGKRLYIVEGIEDIPHRAWSCGHPETTECRLLSILGMDQTLSDPVPRSKHWGGAGRWEVASLQDVDLCDGVSKMNTGSFEAKRTKHSGSETLMVPRPRFEAWPCSSGSHRDGGDWLGGVSGDCVPCPDDLSGTGLRSHRHLRGPNLPAEPRRRGFGLYAGKCRL